MKALIQRVTEARVMVEGQMVGEIDNGLLVFLGVERGDNEAATERMVNRLLAYRIFSDNNGKMNYSVLDVKGSLLVVPQFTLAADTNKGLRPSFTNTANVDIAENLYLLLLKKIQHIGVHVSAGMFAADMKVHLVNDGPVTFMLETTSN